MNFFPIILHRSTSRGTLMTEWLTNPEELKAAIKDLLETSKDSPVLPVKWVDEEGIW